MRAKSALAALCMLAALAACANNGLLPAAGLTADEAGASAFAAAEGEPGKLAGGFNPFAEPTAAPGGRTVIEKPTIADIMQTGALPEMAFGRQDAPVTIVQYASLTCPHCRRFHRETFPELKRAYIDTGKVRFILREFPIGRTSGAATIALRCAPPERYLELYGRFLEQQASWVSQEVRLDPIFAVASQVGMTRQQFDACRENQAMIAGLNWVKERGRTLGVIGTPNFFVEGTLVKKVLTMEEIRAMIEPIIKARAAGPAPG